jgi:hypothetical protein
MPYQADNEFKQMIFSAHSENEMNTGDLLLKKYFGVILSNSKKKTL